MTAQERPYISSRGQRFAKYAFIMAAAAVMLTYIAIFFTNYMVKRDVEAEIASLGAGHSIETLAFNTKLTAASVGKFKDYRCLQRDAITFYRLATMQMRAQLGDVYAATLDARRALRQFVGRHGDALDVAETNRKLDNA